jgi:hypothetical protein
MIAWTNLILRLLEKPMEVFWCSWEKMILGWWF